VKHDRVFLLHIQEVINDIREFTREGHEAFLSDRKTQFTVVRSLEVIGEATKAHLTCTETEPSAGSVAGHRQHA